ncbi:unnamed protein product [Staurois parvus]|uniref:Uncharacterized protein n=1 Tax=Staurois parvus TaxID=386267 RepID=A0ABN9D9J4_9NEOB|nr:unnamed protein product [Staurois parvus]
MHLEVCTL